METERSSYKSETLSQSGIKNPAGIKNPESPVQHMSISSLMIAGGFVITVFFIGVMGWSATAPLDGAAIATGVVKVDSNRKTLQHLEGGIVREIRIRDGDHVKAGEILVVLDKTQAQATLSLYHGRKINAEAKSTRLVAERDGLMDIPFPDWILNADKNPVIQDAIRIQTDTLQNRRDTLHGQEKIINQQISQYYEEITGIKRQIVAQNKEIKIITAEEKIVRVMLEKGLSRKPRLMQLERDMAGLEGMLGQNKSKIASIHQRIAGAKLNISGLEREFHDRALEELQRAQSELLEMAERERAARDILARTEIRAPLSGTIVNSQVHSLSGVIAPRETLMEIVPEGDALVIEARVNPVDIDVVHAGLTAHVRLTAFSRRNALPIEGVVTNVSADTLIDERTGEAYFTARVTLKGMVGEEKLYPGMQAEVMILTGERTALEYLLKPLEDSFRRSMTES